MADNEKLKELQKLARKANARMRKQLKDDRVETGYRHAEMFLVEHKLKKFYSGAKYKESEIEPTLKVIKDYLATPTTTARGYKKEIEIPKMKLMMTYDQKVQYAQKLAKRANARLRTLESNNINYYAYEHAEYFNKAQGREKNRYYTGKKYKDKDTLNRQIYEMERFLDMETSTPKGIQKLNAKRIKTFKEKGFDIQENDIPIFVDFLSSNQLTNLSKYGDSSTIIEDFITALHERSTVTDIQKDFNEYKQSVKSSDYFNGIFKNYENRGAVIHGNNNSTKKRRKGRKSNSI